MATISKAEAKRRVIRSQCGNGRYTVSVLDPSRGYWVNGPAMDYARACQSVREKREQMTRGK